MHQTFGEISPTDRTLFIAWISVFEGATERFRAPKPRRIRWDAPANAGAFSITAAAGQIHATRL